MYFGPLLLGRFDERELKLYGAYNSKQSKPATLLPMLPV